jgi:hypothetical protein
MDMRIMELKFGLPVELEVVKEGKDRRLRGNEEPS